MRRSNIINSRFNPVVARAGAFNMITIIADIDAVRIRYWFNLSEMIELSTWRDFLNGRAAIGLPLYGSGHRPSAREGSY